MVLLVQYAQAAPVAIASATIVAIVVFMFGSPFVFCCYASI